MSYHKTHLKAEPTESLKDQLNRLSQERYRTILSGQRLIKIDKKGKPVKAYS
jgi:hypothetical protein